MTADRDARALLEALADLLAPLLERRMARDSAAPAVAAPYLSSAQWAREHKTSAQWARRVIRDGRLPAIRMGRSWRVRRDAEVAPTKRALAVDEQSNTVPDRILGGAR